MAGIKRFYRVRDGMRHGADNRYGPGDVLELTDEEAGGLLDKLVQVEGGETPEPTSELTVGVTPEPHAKSGRKGGEHH